MIDKLQEYKDRQKDWRDFSITQLSTVNNILLTLSSGLFAFCIDKSKVTAIHINFSEHINWVLLAYWISLFLLGISIIYGIGVLLSRLYDFRISRHIALTRQRFYKAHENDTQKELPYNDFGDYKPIDRLKALFKIVFCKLPFITPENTSKILDGKTLKDDFQNLRRIADILGTATWRWTKIQIGLFLISGVLYLIHHLTQG